MKKPTASYRWRLAVYWLCAALFISVTALIGCGYQMQHRSRTEDEKNALLLASDLLSLRDSMQTNDDSEAVYRALIECRAPFLWKEKEVRDVLMLLQSDQLDSIASRTEQAVKEGVFCASFLRSLIGEYRAEMPIASASEPTENAVRLPYGETDAVTAARDTLKLRYLRSAWSRSGKAAFCRNAYVRFDERGRYLQAYTVFCVPGEAAKTENECLDHAVRFARDQASMNVRQILDSRTEGGIRYFLLQSERETACVGVRQDSAGVCFFLRIPKKSGNVLQ